MIPAHTLARLGSAISRQIDILEAVVRRGVQNMARLRRRRATIRMFQGLGDHLLTDVGLDRCQIVSAVDRIGRQQLSGDPTAAHVVHDMQSRRELLARQKTRDLGHVNRYGDGFEEFPGVCARPAEETPV